MVAKHAHMRSAIKLACNRNGNRSSLIGRKTLYYYFIDIKAFWKAFFEGYYELIIGISQCFRRKRLFAVIMGRTSNFLQLEKCHLRPKVLIFVRISWLFRPCLGSYVIIY